MRPLLHHVLIAAALVAASTAARTRAQESPPPPSAGAVPFTTNDLPEQPVGTDAVQGTAPASAPPLAATPPSPAPEDARTPVSGAVTVPETAATDATDISGSGTNTTTSAQSMTLSQVRDPFWPIGWTPPPVEALDTVTTDANRPKGPIRWEEATRRLSVTGLTALPGNRYIATIKNVGVVEAGDRISLDFEGLIYHWEVQMITDKGIVPRRLGISAPRNN